MEDFPEKRHSRAMIRHQEKRWKARVRRQVKAWDRGSWYLLDDPVWFGQKYRTRMPCSCPGCGGNPRRWTGAITYQEFRQAEADHYEAQEGGWVLRKRSLYTYEW